MLDSLTIPLITILFILSSIHWYWAFGGQWGFSDALPTNMKGERVLNPRRIDSAIVGLGLFLFGVYYIIRLKALLIDLPDWISSYVGWLIGLVFLLRAIGDFNYVGFFRKVRTTDFAYRDRKYFSPLCLIIATLCFLLEL